MTHDFKLAFLMLLKYPGLTLAGDLALTIGIGVGWYQTWGKSSRRESHYRRRPSRTGMDAKHADGPPRIS